jgi:hypothetical protein
VKLKFLCYYINLISTEDFHFLRCEGWGGGLGAGTGPASSNLTKCTPE